MPRQGSLYWLTRKDPETGEYTNPHGKPKIFISYKKSDSELTGIRDRVAYKVLELVDCAIWYDENLTPGKNYDDEIIEAITKCEAVVLILTPNILDSKYVWEIEIATAAEQNKGIIPIAYNIGENELAIADSRFEHRHMMFWPKEPVWEEGSLAGISEAELKFDRDLENMLDWYVVNADLKLKTERFFASNRHKDVPECELSYEERFVKGFGYLRGIGTKCDVNLGVELIDAVVYAYGDDTKTSEIKGRAALELFKHYRTLDRMESSLYAISRRFGKDDSENVSNKSAIKKAFAYAEKGAMLANTECMRCLVDMYMYIERDKKKAFEWSAKAADLGNQKSMVTVGAMYYNGEGVERNVGKAIHWFTKAAELGNADAMNNLGVIYATGKNVQQNLGKSVEWYTKAARLGSSEAMNHLGFSYLIGRGVDKDYVVATEWFVKAGEHGNATAMNIIGCMYIKGEGIEQNKSKAAELFTKAAELGNSDGMFNLGKMHYKGDGVERDKTRAAEWFTKAAERGHTGAMLGLGEMCDKGDGVARDKTKAVEWYTKAADLGNKTAQMMLDIMSELNAPDVSTDTDNSTPAPEEPTLPPQPEPTPLTPKQQKAAAKAAAKAEKKRLREEKRAARKSKKSK